MASYICKCGRVVKKSTTADNTGNRDTAGCEGCPYLLPWGPDKYVQGQGFIKDIQGYECRVSPTLEYRTELHGRLDDKTTIRITSLDFDFLERVSDWVKEHYPNGELSGRFSRDRIRAVEYVDQGRYRYTLACSQNKKGIAAKCALWAEFFDEGFHRKDMDADAEKQKILRDIEQGKATHKDAAATDKERNTVLIYRDPATGWLYRVSPQPENGSYVMQCCDPANSAAWKWCADWNVGNIYWESLEEVLEARAKREGWEPVSDLASGEAMKTADDSHGIMTEAGELLPNGSECRRYVARRARTEMGKVQAIHVCDDQPEGVKIWLNASYPGEYWVLREAGKIEGEHVESCPYCAALLGIGCGDVLLVPFGAELKSNKPPKIPEKSNEPACSCAGCKREDCTCAGGRDAAGRADCTGEQNCAQSGCTYAVKHRANPTPADADASPCAPGASDAPLSPSPSAAADAVSLAAEEAPAFDYSEFDAQTVADLHLAEREYAGGKKMAEMGLRRMADAVAIAHDALCGSCDKMSQLKHGNRGENTFGAWCESIGIHRKAAERLLQVAKLMDGSTPREEKVLEELSPTLLYAAAKPSAPAELVQAVKDGDITTHKQYQEAMAQLKAEREARKKAEHDAQRYREDSEKAREAAHTYHCQYEQANQQRNALLDQQTEYIYRIEAAEKDKAAAQRRAVEAEKERDGARQALRGSKKQEEKWRERATSVQEQLDQLQAQPIPSTAIDMDEVEQRVSQRLAEERAKQSPEDLERAQQDSRDAYDAFILATRSIDNIWKTLRPQVGRLGALQGNAKNMLLQQLMKVKEDLIHECENRQS